MKSTTSKLDKVTLGPKNDRRIKLTEEDKEKIRSYESTGEYTRKELAEKFGVHYSYIRMIVDPDALKQVKEINKKNRHKYPHDKEHRRIYQQELRARKRRLMSGETSV